MNANEIRELKEKIVEAAIRLMDLLDECPDLDFIDDVIEAVGLYNFAITRYGYEAKRTDGGGNIVEWGQSEVCPHCDSENYFPYWDPDRSGFIAVCEECGEEIFLCDACLHHEDNLEQKCDWCELSDGGKCFRGRTKLRN